MFPLLIALAVFLVIVGVWISLANKGRNTSQNGGGKRKRSASKKTKKSKKSKSIKRKSSKKSMKKTLPKRKH